ncbi:hypothetical protein NB693_25710 [Pantoea ananatis]|uniref:glycoside hydrolase family 30 beta sandwich domain-containing protein n=1 Tax=Pantoea ananas TaxID=553 RepID=UPI00222115F6|nr:hypothetical protein [Pantoea ananatis]
MRARAHGAVLLATPWSAPAYMKSNNNLNNGGKLLPPYAKHLLDFTAYMDSKGAPIYALAARLPQFHQRAGREVQLLAAESLGFNTALTDPVLNSSAAQYLSIVGGHLYGVQPKDYPLARSKGKQLWMTEHYTDNTDNTDGNAWPSALGVGSELHNSMLANYSGYIWWYIRRSYGLIAENGTVSKRGYVMSQYARFVRPGSVRIGATAAPYNDVAVSAYKTAGGKLVLVAVNTGTQHRQITVRVPAGSATAFTKYSTSSSLNVGYGGKYSVASGQTVVYVDPQAG